MRFSGNVADHAEALPESVVEKGGAFIVRSLFSTFLGVTEDSGTDYVSEGSSVDAIPLANDLRYQSVRGQYQRHHRNAEEQLVRGKAGLHSMS